LKDYSQYGEQAWILKALGYVEGTTAQLVDGEVVSSPLQDERLVWDLGAWHPTEFSNSRALIELGWQAVLVEPSPGPMLNLLEAYSWNGRVRLVQAAVGILPGLLELFVSDDAVSTTSQTEFERWEKAAEYRGAMLVPTITLEQIAQQFGGAAFVNIDVEGHSAEIFLRMLDLALFPACVCVEHDGRTPELMSRAGEFGYVAKGNSTNLVFWR
jgi:FkbM family methyltransferase